MGSNPIAGGESHRLENMVGKALFNLIGAQLVSLQVNIVNYKINPTQGKTGTAGQRPNNFFAI
jgi:hypothetical protein